MIVSKRTGRRGAGGEWKGKKERVTYRREKRGDKVD